MKNEKEEIEKMLKETISKDIRENFPEYFKVYDMKTKKELEDYLKEDVETKFEKFIADSFLYMEFIKTLLDAKISVVKLSLDEARELGLPIPGMMEVDSPGEIN